MTALLEVEQLEVVYQRVITAVQGVSLSVGAGEIVALLGPNGAGKSTTLRAVSSFLDADDARITDGHVRFRGEAVTRAAPHALARRGLVLIPEREKVFAAPYGWRYRTVEWLGPAAAVSPLALPAVRIVVSDLLP